MYIRINLLPRDMRPRRRLIAFDYRLIIMLAILIAGAVFGWYYISIGQAIAENRAELAAWRQQEQALQGTLDLQNEVNAMRDGVARRIEVIRQLTGDSDVRFAMLQHITMITPPNLWLERISERMEDNLIVFSIEGMSYAKQDISTFLARLEEFEPFRSVNLESIRPAPMEIKDAYQFSVRVDIESTAPVEEPTTQQRPGTR